ncbi:MAG TPA: hypothetical protein VES20_09675 [Bryobacteraceae bacterium]|nr:hypothetical protein [Bryobacteraceae bacterium]
MQFCVQKPMDGQPGTFIVSNTEFERKWHRFEMVVWVLLTLVLGCAVAGLLGGGPVARTTVLSGDGLLTVSFDRVIRTHSNYEVEVICERPSTGRGEVRLALGGALLKETPFQTTMPSPAAVQAGNKWTKLTFRTEANEPARITIVQRGQSPGAATWTVALEGGSSVTATQIVLP